jgi:hypothetical protein
MVARMYLYGACGGYVLTLLFYSGRDGIDHSNFLSAILPFDACFVTPNPGARLLDAAIFVAPFNALIYGIAGAIVGCAFHLTDKRRNRTSAAARYSAKNHLSDYLC